MINYLPSETRGNEVPAPLWDRNVHRRVRNTIL
jgi:hypothetical protein